MSRVQYVRGDQRAVTFHDHPDFPVVEGDLVIVHPDDKTLRPFASVSLPGADAATLRRFLARHFAGVALVCSQRTEDARIAHERQSAVPVATAGRWSFPCAGRVWRVGELVGTHVEGSVASSQSVAPAEEPAVAIGRAAPRRHSLGTVEYCAIVEIASAVFDGGVPSQAA